MTKKAEVTYIFNDDHLPHDGWLHACSICNMITSNTKFYSQVEKHNTLYEFHVYICNYCDKNIGHSLKKRIEYYKNTQKYITNLFG